MNYNISISKNFEREAKPLSKKFPSLKSDILKIYDNI